MLPTGRRVLDYVPDKQSMMPGNVTVNRVALWDWLKPCAYREALYADCSDDDVALANALLVREPVRPALTRLRLTSDAYGRVPRAYIRLTRDNAVSLALPASRRNPGRPSREHRGEPFGLLLET